MDTTLTTPSAALLDKASALAPVFRARALDAESLRRLPDETIADLRASGLGNVLLPARVKGHQASLHDFIDVVAAVGKGCGSTAWVLGVVNAHHWLLGLFDQRAQDEVAASRPDFLTSAVIGPRGKATPVEGGYKLSGLWPFCSGSPAADWLMLGAEVIGPDGVMVDGGDFLVPARDATIRDDWDVTGLRGSGSNTVTLDGLFVPAHRYLSLIKAIGGSSPGQDGHGASRLYTSAIVPVLALGICPAALGIAEGALADFIQRLPGKMVTYTFGEQQSAMPATHMQVAQAATRIDTARLLMHRIASDIASHAEAGTAMALIARARARMDCAYAVRLCLEGVEMLVLAAGGSALASANPIQRASRDLHAISMHGLLNLETNLEMYGRILLGLPQNSPII